MRSDYKVWEARDIVLSLTFLKMVVNVRKKDVLSNVFCIKPSESSLLHQTCISRELIQSRLKMSFMLIHEEQIKVKLSQFSY